MKSFIPFVFLLIITQVFALENTFKKQRTSFLNYNVPSIQSNFLIKRESRKWLKRKEKNCKNKSCSLDLKPCPKDCPQSCGYMDSPDPCCPLLGEPTCPDL